MERTDPPVVCEIGVVTERDLETLRQLRLPSGGGKGLGIRMGRGENILPNNVGFWNKLAGNGKPGSDVETLFELLQSKPVPGLRRFVVEAKGGILGTTPQTLQDIFAAAHRISDSVITVLASCDPGFLRKAAEKGLGADVLQQIVDVPRVDIRPTLQRLMSDGELLCDSEVNIPLPDCTLSSSEGVDEVMAILEVIGASHKLTLGHPVIKSQIEAKRAAKAAARVEGVAAISIDPASRGLDLDLPCLNPRKFAK